MEILACPKCQNNQIVKSGIVKNRQRYLCKPCNYFFSVNKLGKKIELHLIDLYHSHKRLMLKLFPIRYRLLEITDSLLRKRKLT